MSALVQVSSFSLRYVTPLILSILVQVLRLVAVLSMLSSNDYRLWTLGFSRIICWTYTLDLDRSFVTVMFSEFV